MSTNQTAPSWGDQIGPSPNSACKDQAHSTEIAIVALYFIRSSALYAHAGQSRTAIWAAALVGAQTVTDTLFGQDVNGPYGIGFYLLAQRADIDAQILNVGRAAPDFLHGEFVGQHLAGV